MKYLTENAEEKIKEMDFCLLEGYDDKYGVRTIDEVVERYLQDCEDEEEKPHTELEVNLFKYKPFFNYRKGIILDDVIERFDDEYREDATEYSSLPAEIFELEKKLYEAVTKNYQRFFGEIFDTIKIDITDEIKEWENKNDR